MTPTLDWDLLGPPLLAGLLVSATHVPLGRQVLARGIIFIDLAVAQIAALGVLAADLGGVHLAGPYTQLAAGVAALLGAGWLRLCERWWPDVLEALIGVTFVLAATAGLLLVAHNPHGAEHIQDILAGQILWVGYAQLWPVAVLYAGVLVLLRAGRGGGRWAFYLAFALAVTASVQLVGVYLVFATLIVPALGMRGMDGPRALAAAYGIGLAGYAGGLWLSSVLDLPAGPLVVWVLAAAAVATRWGVATVRGRGPARAVVVGAALLMASAVGPTAARAHPPCRDDVPALERRVADLEAELRFEERHAKRGKRYLRVAAARRADAANAALKAARGRLDAARERPCEGDAGP
jgi:zinc/manganese transport system permease protein